MYTSEQFEYTKFCFQQRNFIKMKNYLPYLHTPDLPHLRYIQFSSSFVLEKGFPTG